MEKRVQLTVLNFEDRPEAKPLVLWCKGGETVGDVMKTIHQSNHWWLEDTLPDIWIEKVTGGGKAGWWEFQEPGSEISSCTAGSISVRVVFGQKYMLARVKFDGRTYPKVLRTQLNLAWDFQGSRVVHIRYLGSTRELKRDTRFFEDDRKYPLDIKIELIKL